MNTGLTTRGRCLLAAGFAAAVCAVLLNERDLLRVAAFVVALPLLAALLGRRARTGLGAQRILHPERVPAGAKTTVTLRLSSKGRVPASGLLLEDTVPYAAGGKPRFVVDRLSHNAVVELRYPLHPMLRGVYAIGPLTVRVSDPFGMAEFTRQLGEPSKLLVIPRTVPLIGLPRGRGSGNGQDGNIRMRSGQGEPDVVVRQYRHGDDLRKVHWRSTARRDELMVRLEDRPWHSGTTVLLDHRASAHHGHGTGSSLEWAISFAASVCLHLHANQHAVRLVTEDGAVLADETSGADPANALLDTLAALAPSHHRELTPSTGVGGGRELIAVLGAVASNAVGEFSLRRPNGATGLAVLLDVAAWSPGESTDQLDVNRGAGMLRAAGWGVVIARPGDSFAQCWNLLCQANPALNEARL